MSNKLLRLSLLAITGISLVTVNPLTAMAFEEPVAGYSHDKNIINVTNSNEEIQSLSVSDIPIPGFHNIVLANVENNLNIRKKPSESGEVIGKLPKYGGAEILEADDGSGWTKIKSGKVTGYVSSKYLLSGSEASKIAIKEAVLVATSKGEGLRIREKASINSEILESMEIGEEIIVLDSLVVTYGEEISKWVKVSIDSDRSTEGTVGYVAKDYVELSYSLPQAQPLDALNYDSTVSNTRRGMVEYARQFLGNRYVYGGNSLTNGIDCSGFTKAIYAKYGISLSRTSGSQSYGGKAVTASTLKVGDLVFYGNSRNSVNHVAMYIGNGKVIHASNRKDGIKISNMNYRKPVAYRNYIDK